MMALRFTFLGTGGAISPGRAPTSILVDDRILLDAAPSVPPHLEILHKDPAAVTHLLLSHYHADHTFGLPFLLCRFAFTAPRSAPLFIAGPGDVEGYVTRLVRTAFPDVADEILRRVPVRYVPFPVSGGSAEVGDLPVTAFPMTHGIPALGYQITLPGGTTAYSGDTAPCLNLQELLADADIPIVEMTSVVRRLPGHLSFEDVTALRDLLPARRPLILVHLGGESLPPDLSRRGILVPNDLDEEIFPTPPASLAGEIDRPSLPLPVDKVYRIMYTFDMEGQ